MIINVYAMETAGTISIIICEHDYPEGAIKVKLATWLHHKTYIREAL